MPVKPDIRGVMVASCSGRWAQTDCHHTCSGMGLSTHSCCVRNYSYCTHVTCFRGSTVSRHGYDPAEQPELERDLLVTETQIHWFGADLIHQSGVAMRAHRD